MLDLSKVPVSEDFDLHAESVLIVPNDKLVDEFPCFTLVGFTGGVATWQTSGYTDAIDLCDTRLKMENKEGAVSIWGGRYHGNNADLMKLNVLWVQTGNTARIRICE